MYLTQHQTHIGPRWALNGHYLPSGFKLQMLLAMPAMGVANGPLLAPVEALHEVWASGVTYLRSRDARQAESDVSDVYERVYDAQRPEIFFKSIGWRVMGHKQAVRIRQDSSWNVPEPELTLVVNADQDIIGFCIGNDMSSRSIEGENPLYLPQAKTYQGACALGPGIKIIEDADFLQSLSIQMTIRRANEVVFAGKTTISQMKRTLSELVAYLGRELDFPFGVFLMTGTGLVPSDTFTLQAEDVVRITIASLTLENHVQL